MRSDGRRLEGLVAFVEKTLLPAGFEVTTNDRVFNDDGVQIAEFDVQARGKIGTTDFAWLIECRDRPASGPAPASWIEQLVGRRQRFTFNKVTAVSTTGFAAGAVEFALAQGIEVREVRNLSVDSFADWLKLQYMTTHTRRTTVHRATILVNDNLPNEQSSALSTVLQSAQKEDAAILRSTTTGELVTSSAAFSGAVGANEDLFKDLSPNGAGKLVRIHATYEEGDRFIVDTPAGSVPVIGIVFTGELRLEEAIVPLIYSAEYTSTGDGASISQVVSFKPLSHEGLQYSLEMHHLAATGETHVLLRRESGS